ncbi:MAG: hypothetical protein K2H98_04435 [Duncaniella sp.]|nr:hypothetical protein [Duncaniella sp.]
MKFKASLIEAFENDPVIIEDFKLQAEKWTSELMAEILADAIKHKEYMQQDVIEISVTVSIGEPDEDNDEDED